MCHSRCSLQVLSHAIGSKIKSFVIAVMIQKWSEPSNSVNRMNSCWSII